MGPSPAAGTPLVSIDYSSNTSLSIGPFTLQNCVIAIQGDLSRGFLMGLVIYVWCVQLQRFIEACELLGKGSVALQW